MFNIGRTMRLLVVMVTLSYLEYGKDKIISFIVGVRHKVRLRRSP